MSKKLCGNCHKVVDKYKHVCPKKTRLKYIRTKHKDESKTTQLLRNKEWYWFRRRIIIRDKGECQRCLTLFGKHNFEQLEVHHIKPRETYPELMFKEDNVVTLCKQCNAHLGLNGIDFKFNPTTNI